MATFPLVSPVSGRREAFEPHIRRCNHINPRAKEHLQQEASAHTSGRLATQSTSNTSSHAASSSAALLSEPQHPQVQIFSPEQQRHFESDLCKLFVANGYAWNSINNPQTQIFYRNWVPGATLPDRRKLSGTILQQEVDLANTSMRDAIRGSIATGMSDG
ncbi:hypothetical protein FRC11_006576 [Ceratobasidium sp. 423]|nr:hypothetical protein FRC11_006576 [Ceratobasidium sp. 423]